MADYFSVLSKAVAELTQNTAAQRRSLYDRAGAVMIERLRGLKPPLPDSEIASQRAAFEAAVERIEAAHRDAPAPPVGPAVAVSTDDRRIRRLLSPRRRPVLYLAVATLCAAIVVIVVVVGTSIWPRRSQLRPVETAAASGPSYVFLQQPVYYRSQHPDGTVIIDKAQYFLYLIRSSTVALRFGVGIGPECIEIAGLYRVVRKGVWPDLQAAADRAKQLDAELASSQSGPALGARIFYFGTDQRIHGTNVATTIGREVTAGCIRLANEDIIGLFDRIAIDSRVIVMN